MAGGFDIGTNPARPYWGTIQAGAYQGLTTQALWGNLNDAAAELGLESPGVSASAVGQLVGLANRMKAAGAALMAQGSGPLDPTTMVGTEITAATRGIGDLATQFQARYLVQYDTPGGPQQRWMTGQLLDNLPATTDELQADGMDLASSYSDDFGGATPTIVGMQINRV